MGDTLKLGATTNRDHGALKLRGVVRMGERRLYAEVLAYYDGEPILLATRGGYVANADMSSVDDMMFRIAGGVAVKLAKWMESA